MNEVNVLEIKDTNCFLIKKNTLENYRNYVLNGESLSDFQKNQDLVISTNDVLTYDPKNTVITHYVKGDDKISVDEYKSKPQYYDEDSSDEHTLRAIANKKELKDYEPVREPVPPKSVSLKICGVIEDTNSSFISCSLPSMYSEHILYTLDVMPCVMDEYNKLRKKYSSHANFEKPEKKRDFLRFVKINNNYAFSNGYPFIDGTRPKSYLDLKSAKDEEFKIRGMVRAVVDRYIKQEDNSEFKKVQVLNNLRLIKKLKTKASMLEMINALINDLEEVVNIK